MTYWLIGAVILIIDQVTKVSITRSFIPGETLPVLGPVLSLTYVENTGAAFGLFKGQVFLFILFSVVVVVWVLREFWVNPPVVASVGWGYALLLGGAVGNLIDRLRLGYVIDFIDFHFWPVFNVADSAITIGVGLLILHVLRSPRPKR